MGHSNALHTHTSALMVSLGVRSEAKVNSTVSSVGVGAVGERRETSLKQLIGQLAHRGFEIYLKQV